jgi:hypothetical protein
LEIPHALFLGTTRYHKYARVGTYVPHTNTRMICCVHACTGTKTANLSKPTACMNRSIASTLPRTWQDINKSLDPTAASNWRLSCIKRYTLESRPLPPPFQASRRLYIEWRWWHNYIARWILTYGTYQKGRVSLRAQGTKRQVIFHCAYACPKNNHVMFWNKVTVTGSLASLSMICLASKILCQLGCQLLSLLCSSVVNLLLCIACESRWQGPLSILCLAAW